MEGDMTGSRFGYCSSRLALLAAVAAFPAQVLAEGLHTQLDGYAETPVAISTTGEGSFRARLDRRNDTIEYELSYEGLEGNVLQSHIHFGKPSDSGGIAVFLCSNLGNGPAGTQPCPPSPATITGTIHAADVIGPTGQGIEAGAFDELAEAIREGVAYVNVHSDKWPGGEVRGQLK
jgi:hypothetical protein